MLNVSGRELKPLAVFFTKGRAIFVEGRLKLDQWESKEGEKRSAIRVVLDNFEFVDSRQDSQTQTNPSPSPAPEASVQAVSPEEPKTSDSDLDEDVPF